MTPLARRVLAVSASLGVVVAGAVVAPAAALAAPAPAPVEAPFQAPYYTELDVTGDEQVTTADLEALAPHLGATSGGAGWTDAARFDLDDDGAVTASDLALLSERIIYDDGPFEIVEADAVAMQAAMNAGVITSVSLTQQYLDRIAAYDKAVRPAGVRPLNSIITTSEVALKAAAAADAIRAEKGMTGMLLGIPVALKDNYNTVDMPTTAGCGCWNGNQTSTDATMVKGLRADGAVIVAKASMDEFAINLSSQWSAFQPNGTALTVSSPYDTTQTSGGSSGGTGAAIAANLAGIGFGTDTGGSIRIPSTYNQLVGVRPTVGLASRDGIVPLALSQDTGGPIARSVQDAAIALDAVVGEDAGDPVTARQAGKVPETYTSYLDSGSLNGKKFGYFPRLVGTNTSTVAAFEKAVDALEAKGATVVELTPPTGFDAIVGEGQRQWSGVQPRPAELHQRVPQPLGERAEPARDLAVTEHRSDSREQPLRSTRSRDGVDLPGLGGSAGVAHPAARQGQADHDRFHERAEAGCHHLSQRERLHRRLDRQHALQP
ncbi:amidase family protein [Microbacterium sp. SORGH_AS_0454]|uniref:amidase family protein n=1 Tax=Microbacterium sp. SORGH_AS_0454 TaxID=3041758 RepID=UPI00285465C9|nr:amidase family protein [Microbacterium sp. SORGH_AS_0454]MDR6097183.1 amidase [Microbacterium sp. SORGH_AS_0454]